MVKFRTIKLGGLVVSFYSWWELLWVWVDVFLRREYDLKLDVEEPVILDCGANIGVSVLWFKKQYPKAKIVAFEPNKLTFKLLKKNVEQNNLKNVKLVNVALSKRDGFAKFWVEGDVGKKGSWGDSLGGWWVGKKKGGEVGRVRTERLSKYIKGSIDLLKMDIEGAEGEVFEEIEDKLKYVGNVAFEFHGLVGSKKNGSCEKIYKILSKAGFKYEVIRRIRRGKRYMLIVRGWRE